MCMWFVLCFNSKCFHHITIWFSHSQTINICFVHFVHIPLRYWKWQKSVKFLKIKAPREVWRVAIHNKIGRWPGFAQFLNWLIQFSFPTIKFTRIHQKAILSVLQLVFWYGINFILYDLISCLCIIYSVTLYPAMASYDSLTLLFYSWKDKKA